MLCNHEINCGGSQVIAKYALVPYDCFVLPFQFGMTIACNYQLESPESPIVDYPSELTAVEIDPLRRAWCLLKFFGSCVKLRHGTANP